MKEMWASSVLKVTAGSTALEEERDMLKQLGLFAAICCCLQNSASLNHEFF